VLLFDLLTARPTSATLFPYTTLFRSGSGLEGAVADIAAHLVAVETDVLGDLVGTRLGVFHRFAERGHAQHAAAAGHDLTVDQPRSEEHTSELQSRENLVCRLLLARKN